MVALLPQEETTEDGMQLAPPGFNAIVLPFADEVREVKATEEGDVKQEGWLTLISFMGNEREVLVLRKRMVIIASARAAVGGGGVLMSCIGEVIRCDHRPSHLCNAGTEHVGFSPTRQILRAPSAMRREVFGESHEG